MFILRFDNSIFDNNFIMLILFHYLHYFYYVMFFCNIKLIDPVNWTVDGISEIPLKVVATPNARTTRARNSMKNLDWNEKNVSFENCSRFHNCKQFVRHFFQFRVHPLMTSHSSYMDLMSLTTLGVIHKWRLTIVASSSHSNSF